MSVSASIGQQGRTTARSASAWTRQAGLGGLVFVAALVAQNIIRAGGRGFGAAPAQVSTYFLHHRVAALIPLGLFPVERLALFAFVAAIRTVADQQEDRWWASVGTLGAATIAALFSVVNVTEIVLTAKAGRLASAPAVVDALWGVHAAAFGLDLAAIAVALIGLSRAAAAVSLIPRWLAVATWPGAACLLVAAVFTVALADGGPWVAVGLAGFLVWLAFVGAAGISLLRGPRTG